jgi:RNA polymerase sigma-70 factor (ECF subfamily)
LSPSTPILDPAFRALFDEHGAYVTKTLRRLGVRPGDAEDLSHEVFLTVLRRWDTYDTTRPARPWLFAFCRGLASAYRQSAYVRRETFQDVEPEPERVGSAEGLLVEREESALVYRALDALDDDKRVVFTMFELDERSAADIGAELGIPANTVFSRLRAAREEFARAVKRLSREPPRPLSRSTERPHAQ